ncbi:hypothetical protein [Streptomyces sp. NPDC015350]
MKRASDQREQNQLNAAFQQPAFGEDAGSLPHRPPHPDELDEPGIGTTSD